jgi:hypothetical protein
MKKISYKGYRFPPEIIQQAISDYLSLLERNRASSSPGSVTLPDRARNKSLGTSSSRRSDNFTPRLQGQCSQGSVCSCSGEMTLDVESVVGCGMH